MSSAPDTGLAAERTRLAWRRTTLAGTVVALLAARLSAISVPAPGGVALTALAILGWPAVLLLSFRRLRSMMPGRPAPIGRVLGLAALTAGYAALGTALVLAAPPA